MLVMYTGIWRFTKTIVMNKAELYARYENYGADLQEIPSEEYLTNHSEENRDKIRYSYTGNVECYEIVLDGVIYMWYSCTHSVGWQGDVEGHSFFCKKKTITKAEMDEMEKMFCESL